ncbi:hypothetical protein ZIOFF_060783 [Zingiber officinale]|uniref:Uncharacterized protein n=1 Tax=Zingiber officinale TaxID=94328 RepID=A0A8J5KCA4_ZINOF|nr:hypothetical protein ZIOFF_060783 [Zingiber officinale]
MKGDSSRLFATAIPAAMLLVQADCSIWNLEVQQKQTGWLRGIPVYQVSVINTCLRPNGCMLGNIHLTCGDFNTSFPVIPAILRRLSFNDCLLWDGAPLPMATAAYFDYGHSEPYPMRISSVTCIPQDT